MFLATCQKLATRWTDDVVLVTLQDEPNQFHQPLIADDPP
jgi:hypothetical protein